MTFNDLTSLSQGSIDTIVKTNTAAAFMPIVPIRYIDPNGAADDLRPIRSRIV